ncbi:MAG TPA: hypothetical protein VEU96_15475 [Bryobacteraceae bacterium]|nr:hypothetical protein [Bryobacteraceae bacterium]
MKSYVISSTLTLCALLDTSCACEKPRGVGIEISRSAHAGFGPNEMDMIAGKVHEARPDHRVVIYSHSGDRWWVQPYDNAPYTAIGANGEWSAKIHLGFEYAAVLVCRKYKPVAQTMSLPPVEGDVLAIDVKPASGQSRANPTLPPGREGIRRTSVSVAPLSASLKSR